MTVENTLPREAHHRLTMASTLPAAVFETWARPHFKGAEISAGVATCLGSLA